ncbi:MAG: cobaltochelatase subunit CobN [Candidatus Hodgkinia cicadicola]
MEILACFDTVDTASRWALNWNVYDLNRLLKLVLLSADEPEVGRLAKLTALAAYASLLVMDARLANAKKVVKLAAACNLVLIALESDGIKSISFQSRDYGPPTSIGDSLMSFKRILRFVCRLICLTSESDIASSRSGGAKLSGFNGLPLRCYDRNMLVCCHGLYDDAIVRSIMAKLTFLRCRPVVLAASAYEAADWARAYLEALQTYSPTSVANLTCFYPFIKSGTSVSSKLFQLASTDWLLRVALASGLGIKAKEVLCKVWLSETRGEVFARCVGFRLLSLSLKHNFYISRLTAITNRVNFVVSVLTYWADLSCRSPKILFVLANYPVTDARIGCGVGLDTLSSVANLADALRLTPNPHRKPLIRLITSGVTNVTNLKRLIRASISLNASCIRSARWLPVVEERWGRLSFDPFVVSEFCLISMLRLESICVAVQPTRGYGLIKSSIYHSLFVVPCSFYCLSYLLYWRICGGSVYTNVGKHGNLEWLPGKSVALSRRCYPESTARGSISCYLFIVNNPGEGIQAKRRIGTVIVSHDLPLIQEAANIGVSRTSFGCYAGASSKYSCGLLSLQFKCKLHVCRKLIAKDVISGTLLLLKWKIKAKLENLSLKLENWGSAHSHWRMRTQLLSRLMLLADFVVFSSQASGGMRRALCLRFSSCFSELRSFIKSSKCRYVEPSLAAAFSRADDDVLPTGRNFFSKNVCNMPTPLAYCVGKTVAKKLVRRYYTRSCSWLKTVAVSVWATSNMRTGGDDTGIIMSLLGVKPIWSPQGLRVVGFEVEPLNRLRRFRTNVLVRISGLFRDTCTSLLTRLHWVLEAVSRLNETESVAASFNSLFCCAEGLYGTGIQELLDGESWAGIRDVAKKYVLYGSYVYDGVGWRPAVRQLVSNLRATQVMIHSQDNYEHDLLDSDDYYQYEGGLNAAIRFCRSKVCAYHVDTSEVLAKRVKLRRLKHEIARLVSCKLLNPMWALSMLGCGFRGGGEVLANISYFCNFSAITEQVVSSQFDGLFDMFVANQRIVSTFRNVNPTAHSSVKAKLLAAAGRGVWNKVSNSFKLCLEA